ncbi:hypothetical protein ELY40_11865 [Vreelandella populi]|nr:hypothetical protein ELY40_11865 [Halomonas populi]
MTPEKLKSIVDSYERLKNLKLVALETGVKWQTVYWNLKKAGVEVCGDKARYGSASDRIAVIGEQRFLKAVPFAEDNNKGKWQASVDFSIGEVTVDVKASLPCPAGRTPQGKSFSAKWSFCINKQTDVADYFVLYALNESGKEPEGVFLIPREIAASKSTISIPTTLKSKWADYSVKENELAEFFEMIIKDLEKRA